MKLPKQFLNSNFRKFSKTRRLKFYFLTTTTIFIIYILIRNQRNLRNINKRIRNFYKFHLACYRATNPKSLKYEFRSKFDINGRKNCRMVSSSTNFNEIRQILTNDYEDKKICFVTERNFDAVAVGKSFDVNVIPEKIKRILLENLKDEKKSTNFDNADEFSLVTASSEDHFGELQKLIEYWISFCSIRKLIVYDLGLNVEQAEILKTWNITVRRFDFENYPKFVENLLEYRWKILILTEMISISASFVWLDASFRFDALTCKELLRIHSTPTSTDFPAVLLYLDPRHSILSSTHPNIYKYFPTNVSSVAHARMLGTGVMMLRRSPALQFMQTFWVLCALTQDCLAPAGSVIKCHWDKTENRVVDEYSCCHRFDQSLINVLLYDYYGTVGTYYVDNLSFSIRRDFFNY